MTFMYRLVGIAFLSLLVISCNESSPKVIAHRGFWSVEGSAQNSLRALEEASRAELYGSEFDVHLTADNVLVVYHDDEIDGISIQSATYESIKDCTISNGERLPTVEDYLKLARTLNKMQLIYELKPHKTPQRNREAAKLSVEMIESYGLEDQTSYISFNLDAVKEFKRCAPQAEIAYLNGELSPVQLKALDIGGLDYNKQLLLDSAHWIEQSKELGLSTNVWTIRNVEEARLFIDLGVDYITTDCPLEVKELIQ